MKKYYCMYLIVLVLLSGCTTTPVKENTSNQSISNIKVENIKDIIPISKEIVKDQKIKVKSYILNAQTGERINTDILFDEVPNLFQMHGYDIYSSAYQYYKDRLVIGCQSGGGKSYVYKISDDGQLTVDTVNYNILYYDENKRLYIAQTDEGYVTLNEKYAVNEEFPVLKDSNITTKDQRFILQAYGVNEIYYLGRYGEKTYQLMKYNSNEKKLVKVYDLVEELKQQGIDFEEGSEINPKMTLYKEGQISYISISVDRIWNGKDDFKEINKNILINITNNVAIFDNAFEEDDSAYPELDFSRNVMQSSDKISIFKLNEGKIIRVNDYDAEDIINDGDNHINYIYRMDDKEIIMNVPSGVVKYNIAEDKSEQLYVDRLEE
ncbi:hypothetical protein HCB33_04190 [Listeria sp. FSL L7-0233]|uniref:hypothetical protein n=1 Tax=Listeria cossartiae TaxID=2838249 RepID=UPI001626C50C|nr:hypothetical protein [Listeria cossartiae]MBC2182554.1 hypothetical protein [Listeria cossartiae subsp. cossartiae]